MPVSEYEARRRLLGSELAQHKIDALIVSSVSNVRYLSGFTGSNATLLVLPGETLFFTDPRYKIQSAEEVGCKIKVCSGPLLPRVVSVIEKKKIRRIGFEKAHVTFESAEFLKSKLPLRTTLEPVGSMVERHRMIKSEQEIGMIRASVATNSQAFEQALAMVQIGMREADLAAEMDYQMRRLGAEKSAFETIVAAGPRSALPHAKPGNARLDRGHLVLVDMGAMQNGYASDMTRMLFLGAPSAEVKRLYRAVLDAQLAAIAAVRPGVRAVEVDRAARTVLKTALLDRKFVHSTGHGLGLDVHEPPRIGKKEKLRLEKGMTITIEPGVYLSGFGGIRIEDTVVVTDAGCEVLTPTSKELRVI